jgi:hypothetical protein
MDVCGSSNITHLCMWYDPVKLDRFGCEYFLTVTEETTHEAQSK